MIALLLGLLLSPVSATPPASRVDAYGDRLPLGAVARLGSVRWRYLEPPEHLIWSPDGKYLVGTHGNRLTIWSYPAGVVTGRFELPQLLRKPPSSRIRRLQAGSFTPDQVQFDRNGRSLLVCAATNQLYRIFLPDARWERIDTGNHPGEAVALSADGRRLLMETPVERPGEELWSELSLIDLNRPRDRKVIGVRPVVLPEMGWKRLERIVAPESRISVDGRYVVMGFIRHVKRADSAERRVAVVDVTTGESKVCDGPSVTSLEMSPDGKSFISFNADVTMSVWRLGPMGDLSSTPPATRIASRATPFGSVESHRITPDGRRLVVVGMCATTNSTTEQTVSILDARSLREGTQWEYKSATFTGLTQRTFRKPPPVLAVSPDSRTLALVAPCTHIPGSPLIRFFDVETGKEHHGFGGHNEAVTALVSPAPGTRLISTSGDQIGRVWDLDRLRAMAGRGGRSPSVRESDVLHKLEENGLPRPQASKFKVLYEGFHNRMELRHVDSDELLRVYEEGSFASLTEADRPKSLPSAIGPSEDWFAYAVEDRVVVRALDSGQVVATFRVPNSTPTAVASIPGTDFVAAGYHDGQILIWDLLPRDVAHSAPTVKDFERLWRDLGGDVRSATRARAIMLAHPSATVAALRDLAKPFQQPTDIDIDKWIVRLGHARFAEREKAARELARHYELSESPMREVLAATQSVEMEERLRRILDRRTDPILDADELRLTRAAAILERIGTPEAKKELFRLARGGGQPADRAADALVRMRERDKSWATLRPMGVVW